MKKIHLIAIGGAIMHNLAIALKRKGYEVSGSDDAIYDPARTNLQNEGLLPETGWNPDHIHPGIDHVILGMHAREDNPELIKAMELGIPISSFPEFVAGEAEDKTRVVIGGSHGKTTTTAMIMHALRKAGVSFDYLVGSSIDGFDLSVELSDAPIIIIEGDEYLSSPIDRRSKFLWYDPHISILTGIAYDHINVFPTFDLYLDTFRKFIELHKADSEIIWFKDDEELQKMKQLGICKKTAYGTPDFQLNGHQTSFLFEGTSFPLSLVGKHNLQNLEASRMVCERLGISSSEFLRHMEDFEGAGKRMEKIFDNNGQVVYRDFAHSPSKLKATVNAVRNTYTDRPLSAFFELHTFSSLNEEFLPLYSQCMAEADRAIVYVDPHVFEHRKKEPIAPEYIKQCFGNVEVLQDKDQLLKLVQTDFNNGNNILLMSSGTFSGAAFNFS